MMTWEQRDAAYRAAEKKAASPNFSIKDNPLIPVYQQDAQEEMASRNMQALKLDAQRRADPRTGHAYAAIMDTRYNGGN